MANSGIWCERDQTEAEYYTGRAFARLSDHSGTVGVGNECINAALVNIPAHYPTSPEAKSIVADLVKEMADLPRVHVRI